MEAAVMHLSSAPSYNLSSNPSSRPSGCTHPAPSISISFSIPVSQYLHQHSLEAKLKVLEDGLSQSSKGIDTGREGLLKCLEGSLFLHPCNARRALFENQVMTRAIASSQWDVALTAAHRSLVGFKHIYPPDSPLPALQASIAGKLCWRLGKYEEGKLHLQEALVRLQLTHGASHPLVTSLFDILNELMHGEKDTDTV
jgi:hypothetical protein